MSPLTQGGKSVVETDCDAPWVLVKLPAGQYSVAATIPARGSRQRQLLDQRFGPEDDDHHLPANAGPPSVRTRAHREQQSERVPR